MPTQESALASSLAHHPIDVCEATPSTADSWVRGLGQLFRRVALFSIDGTDVQLVALHGMGQPPHPVSLSLHEPTPLRTAVLAASPVIGAGGAPEAKSLLGALGLTPPRAYAVIPLVIERRIVALAYADRAEEPLSLAQLAALFEHVHQLLHPDEGPRRAGAHAARIARRRQHTPRTPAPRAPQRETAPAATRPLLESTPMTLAEYAPVPPRDATPEAVSVDETVVLHDVVVTPSGIASEPTLRARLWALGRGMLAATSLGVAAVALLALAPVDRGSARERLVTVPPESTVATIATLLEDEGVVRNAPAFRILARLRGLDRTLRAGSYHLSPAAWAWTVLGELHRGAIEQVSFTIPEGLTLADTAAILARAGLGTADDFVAAARDPRLLATYGIPAASAEGYLFPETYTIARGLSPRAIVELMLQQFFDRSAAVLHAHALSPDKRHRAVTLASIVEREAKRPGELGRIAGVFRNRLVRHMKLESCATVQYVLGTPKERLLLEDVRTESPYNTYLHVGLPPSPIASPGLAALQAALAPDKHDELFFFAKSDGSGEHVFSRTYAEHQERQRRLGHGAS